VVWISSIVCWYQWLGPDAQKFVLQVVCLIVWGHFHDYGFLYLFVLPSYLLAKALLRAGLLSEEGYATIVISLILIFIFYLLYLEIWYYTHFWGALIKWIFSSTRGSRYPPQTLVQTKNKRERNQNKKMARVGTSIIFIFVPKEVRGKIGVWLA